MKRTLLYIVPAIAVMLGISSCSTDNDITGGGNIQNGNAVIINATVGNGSVFTRSNPVGDKEAQKKFNKNDKIVVSDGTNSVTYIYIENSKTWEVFGSGYLTWHSSPTTFQAYYPLVGGYGYRGTDSKRNQYDEGYIFSDQSELGTLAESDYMKVEKTVSKEPTDHTLSLEFERQTARVIVKIAGYKNQYDASTTTIEGVKVYSQLTVPASGNYEAITTYKNGDDYYALVAPASANDAQQFLEITVKPNGEETTETKTVTGIPAMEAGKSYTYNITVGKDKATIENVTVTDWTTGNVIPGGVAIQFKDMTGLSLDDFKSYIEEFIGTQKGVTLKLTGSFSSDAKDYYQEIAKYLTEHADADLTLDLSGMTITEIPDGAFNYYGSNYNYPEGLTHVILPSSVTKIGQYAFYMTGLESINLGNVTDIGSHAFSYTGLTNVDLTSATSIQENAFGGCTSLTTFTIPQSKCDVGQYAFRATNLGADNNGKFTMPATFNMTDGQVFSETTSIKELTVPANFSNDGDGCAIRDEAFINMTGLTVVIFEASKVKYLGNYCFESCKKLKTIDLSNLAVSSVGDLPELSSTNSGRVAFENCYTSGIEVLVKDEATKNLFEASGSPWYYEIIGGAAGMEAWSTSNQGGAHVVIKVKGGE